MEEEDVLDRARRHNYLLSSLGSGSRPGSTITTLTQKSATEEAARKSDADIAPKSDAESATKSDAESATKSDKEEEEIPLVRKKCSTTVSLENTAIQQDEEASAPDSIETESAKSEEVPPEESPKTGGEIIKQPYSPEMKRLVDLYYEPKIGLEGAVAPPITSEHLIQKNVIRGSFADFADYTIQSRIHQECGADDETEEQGKEKEKSEEEEEEDTMAKEEILLTQNLEKEEKPEEDDTLAKEKELLMMQNLEKEVQPEEDDTLAKEKELLMMQNLEKEEEPEEDDTLAKEKELLMMQNLEEEEKLEEEDTLAKEEEILMKKKLEQEEKERKDSIGEYQSPEQILREMQKKDIEQIQQQVYQTEVITHQGRMTRVETLTDLEKEIGRLKNLLKCDEARMFKESAWGKEAIQEIVRLEDIKSDLEKQIAAGGDASAIKKAVKNIIMEVEQKGEEVLKIGTMYHQTEACIQHNQQELKINFQTIRNLDAEFELDERMYKSKVVELENKRKQSEALKVELQQIKSILNRGQMQNNMLQRKVRDISEDICKLTEKKSTLESEIEKEQSKSAKTEKSYRNVVEQLQKKSVYATSIEMQVWQARENLEKAEKAHIEIENQLSVLKEDAKLLTSSITDLKKFIEEDKISLDQETKRLSEMKQNFTTKYHQLESSRKDQAMLIKNIDEERRLSDRVRKEVAEHESKMETLVETLVSTKLDAASQEEQKKTLKELIKNLEEENMFNKEGCSRQKNALKEKLDMVTSVQESTTLKVESMKNVVTLQQNARNMLNKAYSEDIQLARNEVVSLKDKLKKRDSQIDSYNQAIQELKQIFMFSFVKSSALDSF